MKQLLSIALLFTFLFSCQTTAVEDISPETTYYRLAFEFNGEPTEYSRILKSFSTSNLRTDANIVIQDEVTIEDESFGVAEIKNGTKLTIKGSVTFGNANFINSDHVYITIKHGATLTISSALNMDGQVHITNFGTLITGSVEQQGQGENSIHNAGTHIVHGDVQLSSNTSAYNNCGELVIDNFMNIHYGYYNACDCGKMTTSGLNVNIADHVTGDGFIKVINTLSLNQNLTTWTKILFCYTGHINQESKLGSAKRTCENTCVPPSLPLNYYDLQLINDIISFKVTENFNLYRMRVQQSFDAKSWRDIKEFKELPKSGLFEIKLKE